tara:strand:- start:1267 stop:1425 length:159 start_codon:yes stop_codon:yes gene_type:complete
MVECLSAQPGIKHEPANMGYAGINQGAFRVAYKTYSPVAALWKLRDIGPWQE